MEEEKPSSKEEAAGVSMMRTAETFLRVAPMGLCIGAMVVMVGNSEDNDYGSVSYSNLSAFTYLVYANGICAAYSLFSLILTAMPRPPSLPRAWSVFFCDQVLTYVVLAAGVVSSEILYLAYNGDEKVTWSKQCGIFGGFCKKATTSVGITFGTVVCYVLLSLISSYRLFSTFDAPIPSLSNKGGTEISAFPLSCA